MPSGGRGGGWGAVAAPPLPLEIRQSDYHGPISVISAPPEIKETISALPPAQKLLGTVLRSGDARYSNKFCQ